MGVDRLAQDTAGTAVGMAADMGIMAVGTEGMKTWGDMEENTMSHREDT